MSSPSIDDSESALDLADLAEAITARFDSGQSVDLADYQRKYPEHAEQLVQLIPTLRALGQLGIDSQPTVSAKSPPTVTPGAHPTLLRGAGLGLETVGGVGHQLGDFRIVREIGRGGMGVVYEARQLSLDRRVALKVLPFAAILDSRHLVRFKTEAQAAACLHHPNIVPVHSVGCDRGVHYCAMQYVDGQSLASAVETLRHAWANRAEAKSSGFVSETTETSVTTARTPGDQAGSALLSNSVAGPRADYCRAIAKLGIQAAEALEHAHQSGVIHRDIKPGNLLLDSEDKLWVTDFGLARIEQDSQLTMTGDVIGTIRYMSPEQAVNPRAGVDHRTDVYSLGATLYELLTLRPAYEGDDRQELLTKIAFHDPVPPRKWNRYIPAELETIVLKAMEKEARVRYHTAQALADDLRCFLEYRTISAKRPTIYARIHKWSRRHPSLVRSAAVALVLITLGSAISSLLVMREQAETRQALFKAEENFEQSESNRVRAEEAVGRFERLLYVRGLGLAARAWQDGDGAGAAALMRSNPAAQERPELRGFEWHYLDSVLAKKQDIIKRGASEFLSTASSLDGRYFAVGNAAGEILLWESARADVIETLRGHRGPVHSLAFHPDGSSLASVSDDGTLRIWDVGQTKEIGAIDACHGGEPVFAVAYSHRGTQLATGGADHIARIWDSSSLRQQHELQGHTREIRAVAFAPSDKSLATAGNDRQLRLWDAGTGGHLRTVKGHTGMVLCVAFSPTGQFIISGSNDHTVRVWHSDSGEEAAVISGHHDGVQTVAMLPGGKRLVAGDRGGQLRIWHFRGKRIVDRVRGEHFDRFYTVRLSPDGRCWAGLCADGRLLVRDIGMKRTRVVQNGIATHYQFGQRDRLAFSPDGSRLYCSDRILERRSKDPSDWQPQRKLDVPAGVPGQFSPDGKILATGWNAEINLWNPEDGKLVRRFETPLKALTGLRFSPDGKQLASSYLDGPILIWDWNTVKILQTLGDAESRFVKLEYAPDGGRLATCSEQGSVRVWDVQTGISEQVEVGSKRFSSISWLDDGDALALSAPGEQDVIFWLDESRPVEPIGNNQEAIDTSVSGQPAQFLSHDGKLGVFVRNLDQLEITSDPEDVLQGHTDRVWSLAVSQAGNQLISGSRDGSVRGWSLASDPWKWLTTRRHPDDQVNDFTWTDSGATLVLAQMGRTAVHFWPGGDRRSELRWCDAAGADPMGFVAEVVACLGEREFVATGHRDGFVRIWGETQATPVQTLAACSLDKRVSALRFSPDHKLLVAASREDNALKIWSTDTWEEICQVVADDCDDIDFSSDNRWLAYCDGREAVLLDVDTMTPRRRFRGHSITVHGLAFSEDDRLLATACEDRKLRIWDPETGELQQTFSGHSTSIRRVTFSRDGSTLVSGDADGIIKLWHLESGQELFTLARLGCAIEKLTFDSSGSVLLASTDDGRVHVFEADSAR